MYTEKYLNNLRIVFYTVNFNTCVFPSWFLYFWNFRQDNSRILGFRFFGLNFDLSVYNYYQGKD